MGNGPKMRSAREISNVEETRRAHPCENALIWRSRMVPKRKVVASKTAVLLEVLATVGICAPMSARADAEFMKCNLNTNDTGKLSGVYACKAPAGSGICYFNAQRTNASPNYDTFTRKREVNAILIDYNVPCSYYPGSARCWLNVEINIWYAR